MSKDEDEQVEYFFPAYSSNELGSFDTMMFMKMRWAG